MKKSISIILLIAICLVSLIACTEGGDTEVTTTLNGNVEVTAPQGDAETTLPTSDPTKGDLQGESIKILAWSDTEMLEFEYDETNLDQTTINEAIRTRNENVKENLNCELEFLYEKGNYNNQQVFVNKVEAFANGDEGDFIDIFAAYSMTTALASQKGFAANLMNYQKEGSLNFSNPWWPETLVKEAMFDNMLFVCTGDISTNLLWMMEPMYFNKDLLIDIYGEDAVKEIYKVVEDGKWTIDKFIEYCADGFSNLDEDPKKTAGDQFGFSLSTSIVIDDFYVGAGFRMGARDVNGKLVLNSAWGGEAEVGLLEKLVNLTYEKFYYGSDGDTIFSEGRSIFMNQRARYAKTIREKAEFDYGILPMPKLNEIQENYSTNIGFPYTLYAISNTSTQPENAALVLESMAANGYFEITPVLFEDALKLRYSPELEDAMMFDILRETLHFDVCRIYCTPLENLSWTLFRNSVASGSTTYGTKVKMNLEKAQGLVDTLIADLAKAGNIQ